MAIQHCILTENNFDERRPIRGDILKKALDKLQLVIGTGMKDYLIEDIEHQGIVFDDEHYYEIEEIERRFVDIFGKDTAPLVVERIKKALRDFAWLAIAMLPTLQLGYLCITKGCICLLCGCPDMAVSMGNM